jgi:predicted N-acyltransferase
MSIRKEIEVKVFKTIDEIGKESIDLLADDGFFTYWWLKVLETSRPFKIIPKYIVVYEDDRIIGIAPCFVEYNSQYINGNAVEAQFTLTKILRKVLNRLGFALTPPLICYSPCSFHTSVLLEKSCNERIILGLISKKIDDICKKERILFSSFLYVSEFDESLIKNLQNFGYFNIHLTHTMYLDIKWSNFDDYLASLEYKARKNIRREIKKNRRSGIVIEQTSDFYSLSSILSDLYSNLYFKYMGKRSPLHPLFFEKLCKYAENKARVFIAVKNDKIVGFSLCLGHKNILDVYIAGFDYNNESKTDFTYFNVAYYAPIKAAIEEGIKKIHFRSSAESVKLKRGCKLEKIYTFVKCHSRLLTPVFNLYIKIFKNNFYF